MSEWIISSSVLIVLVIALRHVLRGKISLRLQYALWLVVLVRLLMPVSIADSSFSIASFLQKNQTYQISDIFLWYGGESNPGGAGEHLPDRGENGDQGNQQVGGENPGNLPGNVTTPINPDAGVSDKQPVTDEPVKYPTIGGISIAPSTDKLENSGKEHLSLGKILMVIWCLGMAVTAVMFLVSNLHFSNKLKKTRWLYKKKTDSLPVYESDAVETPCLFGLVRPAIYVTQEAIKDPNIMHHVLAHETTHYAHRDHIWAVLRCLCLVLHWYNPLVWWAADLSRRDAELACDEGTIERIGEAVRAEYGRTLIGLTCQGRGYLLSTATTMTGSVKGIKERIMLIANRPKMARYTVILLIVLVMVMIGCTYCGFKETGENPESGAVYIVEGSEMLSPITEEQRLEIEKAWGSQLGWTRGPGSDRYYGNYNGAVVIFTSGDLSEIGEVEVAGVLFTHGTNCDLRVYKDGTIYSLKEAYYGGLLTREDLLTVQKYHWLYERAERGTMLSNFEMKEEVEFAWAKEKWSKLKWYGLGGDIRYNGTYEGAVVLFEPTGGKKETTLSVGNCKITSDGSFEIHVYKNGEFYSLEKAYERGFITDSNLISISARHERSYEEYEEYQASLEQPPVNIHAKKPVTAGNEIVQRFDAGTTVLADINADGVQEKVTVSQEAHFYIDGRYEFCMQIDDEYYDQFDLDKLGHMINPDLDHFYLVDLDKSDGWLEIGLFARGEDGNKPKLTLVRYQYGEIHVVGIVDGDILAEEGSESWINIHGDGTVESRSTDDSNPAAYVTKYWKLKEASELKAVLAEVVSEEPPTMEPTEEPTEEPTTEAPTEEPTTEEPTTENPFDRVGAEEIEYVLTPSEDYFRFIAKSIEKEGDKYVITGDMVWGGLVLLTEEQKTKLDDGAILKVVYDGIVIERYVATDRQAEFHPDAPYYDAGFGYGDVLNEMTPSTVSDMMLERYGEWVKRLAEEPYNGKGYCLMKDFPSWPCDFVVETNCQWEVSGDLSFYPGSYLTCYGRMDSAEEVWTMERFYQEAIVGDKYSSQGILHHVYVKDGVIVKIIEQYVS